MTQCERILRHMRDYGSITQAEAQAEYGVARLAARIDNLRERGHVIRSELVQGRNRYNAPPLLREAEAAAAPGWHPKDAPGLVAPAEGSGATAIGEKTRYARYTLEEETED